MHPMRLGQKRRRHQLAVTTPDNYYSRGRFTPVYTGAGAGGTATISRAKSKLFSYAEGNVMDAATPGETGTIATSADTNLVGAGGQTIGSHELFIYGISIQIVPSCQSAELLAKVWAEACVTVIYNGKEIGLQIGPPYFIPGQSSLSGIGKDVSKAPPLSGGPWGTSGAFPYSSNGLAGFDNFMRIPEGLKWQSAGKTDSNMTIVVELLRDVTCTVSASQTATNATPAVTGVQGYTSPSAALLAVDFMLKLHARVQRRRSGNL